MFMVHFHFHPAHPAQDPSPWPQARERRRTNLPGRQAYRTRPGVRDFLDYIRQARERSPISLAAAW